MNKIAIVGPESSGKSTLAASLAAHFDTAWAPEYARQYIDRLNRPYREADLRKIAEGQLASERAAAKEANELLICDTNLLVVKVWSEYRYRRCDPWILQQMKLDAYALHLLAKPDLPWQADPQREHPQQREELFDIYRAELETARVAYVVIEGDGTERLRQAIGAVRSCCAG